MLELNYSLVGNGWALLEIDNGEKKIEICVSYLHDSLKSLAESAVELRTKTEKSIIFMDEPGEHQLLLKKNANNEIDYTLKWYKNWASWHLISEENYEIVLSGTTTISKYINQIRGILIKIHDEFVEIGYKEKWGKHEFPISEFEKIK